jgi:peptide/nickel transport system substrate-binding protein
MKLLRCLLFLPLVLPVTCALAQSESQLRFCLRSEPKTLNPVLVADDSSETVRYLTGGVLVRLNRSTQQLQPELATSWKLSDGGKTIRFHLRKNLSFSDGTPFTAADVAYTMDRVMDPAIHTPTGDAFRTAEGKVVTRIIGNDDIAITFPAAIVGLDRMFDQVAIMSAKSPLKEMAVLGPYRVADVKAGSYLLLKRNTNYWKHDAAGRQLPYIDTVRLDIQQNRDMEMLRLERGEISFINSLDAEYYDRLKAQAPDMVYDAGISLDAEQMWFNQVASSPLPAYKKAWFTSKHFRNAISESINREDLARVVFRGHARPAVSWISPANTYWFNQTLKPRPFDQKAALQLLAQDGFRLKGGTLYDRGGNVVEFSVITNAGNKDREKMAAMMQQDLAGIGIRLNVVALDFPSLIERITRTFNYEACLLGLTNNDLDPNTQMNVWMSSAENHQWNPLQKTPATPWEAEIDTLMRAQASTLDMKKRKQAVDKVQAIVWDQEPFLYLVNKDAMSAISTSVHNSHPVVLRPQVYWNIELLSVGKEMARSQ